jgi:hypothetical protein
MHKVHNKAFCGHWLSKFKGNRASRGEFEQLFRLFSNACVKKEEGHSVSGITLDLLQQFYINSTSFFHQAAHKIEAGINLDPCALPSVKTDL